MKQIDLKTKACGPRGNFGPGIVVIDDDLAAQFVEAGVASYVKGSVKVETAQMAPAEETAAMPAPTGRRRARGGDEA